MCQLMEATWFIWKLSADQLIVLPDHQQCSVSYFKLVWEHRKTGNARILDINVLINWQLSKQGNRWPVSLDRIAGTGVDPSRSSIFLKLSAEKLLVFKWSQAQVQFFPKFIWNMLCLCATHLKFWLQTDLGHENSASCFRQGRQLLITFLTMVTQWSRSTSNFYALIGQNLAGEFMRKIYAASWILFTLHWQLKVTEFCVNLWCF